MATKIQKMTLQRKLPASSWMRRKAFEHRELIAALFSGGLILVTWLLTDYLPSLLWVIFHLIAFVIGGYAKAKEGILETIQHKELNVELLMVIAAIGSAAIGYWTEGAILIFIFALAGALETYTLNRSEREISALMQLQPEEAILLKDGKQQLVPVAELKIGDQIFVRASDRIPADGKIVKGSTAIDESAITGESIPVQKATEEEVFAGTVALDGSITVSITKEAHETLFQKIIKMVQTAKDEKSPSQLFIERFEGTYVKTVLAVVVIMMFLPTLLFDWTITDSIYRAMILLVVASPCALVASIMPATLSAISNSAKNGVLFKGGVHLENLSHIKSVAFDKTGTLTKGSPTVTDVAFSEQYDQREILAAAGAIEKESTHPLAKAVTDFCTKSLGEDVIFQQPIEKMHTLSGKGVSATINGISWEIGNPMYVGEKAKAFNNSQGEKLASEGKTVIYIKRKDEIVGLFALKDTLREGTIEAVQNLQKANIYTMILTGDHDITAKAVAKEVGLDDYIAQCLPEEKVQEIKKLRKQYKNVAMVGDGINDAPALASANVGIAMGEGTDVALETADVVLMKNDLPKMIDAINLSRRMNRIIKQNIYFSLGVIALLIVSNFLQVIDLPLGVIGHEGSTILVILNGLRLLRG